jgi:hypothetical protein
MYGVLQTRGRESDAKEEHMTWPTDVHGLAFKPKEVKLYRDSSPWGMRLGQLGRQTGTVYIVTYSLPDLPYIEQQFARRPRDIYLLCHAKFTNRAQALQRGFPDVRVKVHPKVHGKLLLIAPETVYVSSANFGDSGWKEFTVGIRGAEAFDFYHDEFWGLFEQASWPDGKPLKIDASGCCPAFDIFKETRKLAWLKDSSRFGGLGHVKRTLPVSIGVPDRLCTGGPGSMRGG